MHVAGVSEHRAGGETVITLSADMPLSRTQTWQDGEGFHLVLPHAGRSQIKGIPRSVIVRQLDDALELVFRVRPGASVTVEPHFNRLTLVISGSLNTSPGEPDENVAAPRGRHAAVPEESAETFTTRLPREQRRRTQADPSAATLAPIQNQPPRAANPPATSTPAGALNPATTSAQTAGQPVSQPQANNHPATTAPASSNAPGPADANNGAQPSTAPTTAQADNQSAQPQQLPAAVATQSTLSSSLFSGTGVALFLLLSGSALFFLRRRAKQETMVADEEKMTVIADSTDPAATEAIALAVVEAGDEKERRKERRKNRRGRRSNDQLMVQKVVSSPVPESESNEQALEVRPSGVGSHELFGAYRVDQEVCKLILGQPHRLDVLLSRAPDDRRAMETSLMKTLQSSEATEDGRRRARRALEEYGFVARQSAALLLAHDAYERASAARTLGEIRSPLALSFLIEGLYDTELVVRTHSVSSLGQLRLPSALGALLDMAWRHPEMSAELLSRVLSACSVETLDGFSRLSLESDQAFLSDSHRDPRFTGEITHLDPAAGVEQLPEWLEDESLSEALTRLESTDVEARAAAVRQLAQFQVQRSVEALTLIAARDEEPAVRAAAVSSLCSIDHESVFAPVLIALADEAREVRAAAARSLSRLSFDRADAYVRVQETSDAETLREVARSCIKAGIAKQAIDRLASEDRRQAYEAFSMLSILAKSNETEPVLEAIASHPDLNVQLAATRLLGLAGRPEVAAQLRQLVVRDGLPEKVRTAILEVVYKIDQAQPV